MNDTNIHCIWYCGCGRMCYELFPCSTCMEIKYCDGVCAFCIDGNYQCKNKKFLYLCSLYIQSRNRLTGSFRQRQ